MDIVRYNRGKMLFAFLVGAAVAAVFIAFFIYPEIPAGARRGRFLATGFGHHILLPVLIAFMSAFAWRAGALAFGSAPAIALGADAVTVTTISGRHRIAWGDLAAVTVKQLDSSVAIAFRTRDSGWFGRTEHAVNLKALDIHPGQVEELIARIEQLRASGGRVRRPASPPPPEPVMTRPAFGRKGA
jgi:ABC-type Co2+ transport system permease subunit